jgi:hypothetical protein
MYLFQKGNHDGVGNVTYVKRIKLDLQSTALFASVHLMSRSLCANSFLLGTSTFTAKK